MKKRTFSDGNNFPIHQVWTLLDKSQRDARHNNARYCSLYIEAPDGTEMRARLSVRCKLRALKERVAADLSFASSEKAGGSSEREHSQRSADGGASLHSITSSNEVCKKASFPLRSPGADSAARPG